MIAVIILKLLCETAVVQRITDSLKEFRDHLV